MTESVKTLSHKFVQGDCLDILKGMPDNSVDLIFCSPPYEDARLYGELKYKVKGQDWVDWCIPRYLECVRVCSGLVAWVVEGKTRNFQWSATPALLMADLHRQGVRLRKPPAFHRVGIPGSGGPDWLRNDYEFTICSSKGKLPWSDNTAMGHEPKYPVGGKMSNRRTDGERVDTGTYTLPSKANPGNVIHCNVGGGTMGHRLCHENEAPFPEDLVEFYVRSFCKPGGTVLDIFSGSGTTVCVAKKCGRSGLGIELREDQIKISQERLSDPMYEVANDV